MFFVQSALCNYNPSNGPSLSQASTFSPYFVLPALPSKELISGHHLHLSPLCA